jgi:hypothetical protein
MKTETGVKDKNNKMIYVGDTVNLYFYPSEEFNRDEPITKQFVVEEASEAVNHELGRKSFQIVNGKDKRLLSHNLHFRLEIVNG